MSFGVQVLAGEGLLARYGGSLLLVPTGSSIAAPAMELLRQVHSEHPANPGRVLPRRLAGLVSQRDDLPTLAVVSVLDEGLAVLLVGDVRMVLTTDSGTTAQSGRDVATWVDRVVRGPWSSLLLALDGAGAVDRLSDLGQGVVTAAGAELTPVKGTSSAAAAGREPVVEPPTVMAPAPPVDVPPVVAPTPVFETFSLSSPAADLEPAPVEQPAAPVVLGIACSRGHFNDPASLYCATCGISMVQQTHNLVEGVRPPLGVLVLDDGAVYGLAGDYVLGREPEHAPEVISGSARPLALDDPEVTMSRVHARVELVDWSVEIVDADSANGTFVAPPGQTEWTRLPPGGRVVLLPGTKIALGGRTLVFDSHRKT